MRDAEPEIEARGASIVAVGTGDQRYAASFVADEKIPYTVLVDDDSLAARAAGVRSVSFARLLSPRTWKATRETSKRGYHVHRAGKRVTQLGGTWVIAPGGKVVFEHVDADSTDHAPVAVVIAALDQLDLRA